MLFMKIYALSLAGMFLPLKMPLLRDLRTCSFGVCGLVLLLVDSSRSCWMKVILVFGDSGAFCSDASFARSSSVKLNCAVMSSGVFRFLTTSSFLGMWALNLLGTRLRLRCFFKWSRASITSLSICRLTGLRIGKLIINPRFDPA